MRGDQRAAVQQPLGDPMCPCGTALASRRAGICDMLCVGCPNLRETLLRTHRVPAANRQFGSRIACIGLYPPAGEGNSSMNARSREAAAPSPSGRTLRIAVSTAAKPKLPLLHERLRRFPVVFCQARMDVVCDLEVHAFLEVAVDCPVEVFFHVAVGD